MSGVRKFCTPTIKKYPETCASYDTEVLIQHLFVHYPTLNANQRKNANYRVWRRCLIRELLKRGVLRKDPGLGPPERS